MNKINAYGEELKFNFAEQCKKDGTYNKVYVDFEDGTCLLEPSVRNVRDYAAWCLMTYNEMALDVVYEWRDVKDHNSLFKNEHCEIGICELIVELRKCYSVLWDVGDIDIGYVDLFIGGESKCTIKQTSGSRFEFSACFDGCSWHNEMKARTLVDAMAEAEEWFREYYTKGIKSAEGRIAYCKFALECLEEEN